MSQHDSGRNGHRNGGKAKPVPTSEREMGKPYNISASVTNTPDPVIYGGCLLLMVFGLVFLIIGGIYISKCELQPILPIWLLVMGIIIMVGGVVIGFFVRKTKKQPFRKISIVEKTIGIITLLLYFGWILAGNIFVFMAFGQDPDYGHLWFTNGCNKTVFLMSFIAIIMMDAFVGVLIIGCCFWGITKIVVRE